MLGLETILYPRPDATDGVLTVPLKGSEYSSRLLCTRCLLATLEVGFRQVGPGFYPKTIRLNHTSHHEWTPETAFHQDGEEVLADAVGSMDHRSCPCVIRLMYTPSRLACVGDTPFSSGLWPMVMGAIERGRHRKLVLGGLETVRVLDRLGSAWTTWATKSIGAAGWAPTGLESLSSHYWCSLGKANIGPKSLSVVCAAQCERGSCEVAWRS